MSSREDYKVDIATEQPRRRNKNAKVGSYQTNRYIKNNYSSEIAIEGSMDLNLDSQDPYKGWTLKDKLSSRRQEIIKRRTVAAFPSKHRSAS
jgi:hypothetical protein